MQERLRGAQFPQLLLSGVGKVTRFDLELIHLVKGDYFWRQERSDTFLVTHNDSLSLTPGWNGDVLCHCLDRCGGKSAQLPCQTSPVPFLRSSLSRLLYWLPSRYLSHKCKRTIVASWHPLQVMNIFIALLGVPISLLKALCLSARGNVQETCPRVSAYDAAGFVREVNVYRSYRVSRAWDTSRWTLWPSVSYQGQTST